MSWSMVVGLVASGVFLARLLPQPIRLARTGVVAGVSPLAGFNSVITAVAWTAYGVTARLPLVAIVSALAVIPSAWTALLLIRSATRPDWLGGGAWAGIVLVAAVTGRLGFVLAGSVLLTIGPQVVVAVRGEDLRGIAPATMWIALGDASLWGLYGLTLGDGALMAYGLVLFSSAAIVLARIAVTQRALGSPVAIAAQS
ncbi:MAG: hypothetical protein ACT4OV_04650 [Microthrixaceae bacterium]